jgi:hypothetical protein
MSIKKFLATDQHMQQLEHIVREIPHRYDGIVQGIFTILRSFEPLVEENNPDTEKPE